ncbi:MAG: aldo/keto reductase [Gammaproteobacteria bacterium]
MQNSKVRKLGGLDVSLLGLGCVNLSGLYGAPLDDASDILHFAFQNGVTFFDTADAYANGKNEELLSSAFSKHNIARDEIIFSTKCGVVWGDNASLTNGVNNSPKYIKAACEDSLRRLQTDYIDLYYLHRIASNGDAIEESMEALKELVVEGKIRHIGLAEVNPQIIRRASKIHPVSAIQSEYSLMTRDPEINGVLEVCNELNIGFVAYSPLCRGLLSSNFSYEQLGKDDFRHKFPRFKKNNLENNMRMVKCLEEMANEKKCSVVQLSLAWVIAQGDNIVPIPGTKCLKHLNENIKSTFIQLSHADLEILNALFPVGIAAGDRYSPAILRTYNLSTEAV